MLHRGTDPSVCTHTYGEDASIDLSYFFLFNSCTFPHLHGYFLAMLESLLDTETCTPIASGVVS